MRKITNVTNLPAAIVEAVKNDAYNRGDADISITELLSPPRQVALQREFEDRIVTDAADGLFALFGKMGHSIIEHAALDANAAGRYAGIPEKRLYASVKNWIISGAMDSLVIYRLDDGTYRIDDYKFTSVYVYKIHQEGRLRNRITDWFEQLNMYRWLCQQNGYDVTQLQLVLMFRDWSILESKRNSDYPRQQVATIKAPVFGLPNITIRINERVEAHQQAQQYLDVYGQDESFTRCTDPETWKKDNSYAVKKEGRKSALKVESSYEQAMDWAVRNDYAKVIIEDQDSRAELNEKIFIEERKGEYIRCANYCDVADFCEQWKANNDV